MRVARWKGRKEASFDGGPNATGPENRRSVDPVFRLSVSVECCRDCVCLSQRFANIAPDGNEL
ncbi:hypothetical protein ZHAS_00021547 [Anopheles sinensis]|uniref:Uncharacterized protein n=1 Tax=Anopheles sinensis TaxID=74873 RepID=A0A084WSQ2_ANOSI|nr:hypothetical protein ZHAS_00021547 [Anopheles sinensis]